MRRSRVTISEGKYYHCFYSSSVSTLAKVWRFAFFNISYLFTIVWFLAVPKFGLSLLKSKKTSKVQYDAQISAVLSSHRSTNRSVSSLSKLLNELPVGGTMITGLIELVFKPKLHFSYIRPLLQLILFLSGQLRL